MARCRGNTASYITMQHSLRRVLVALSLAVAEHAHFIPTPLSSPLSLSFRRADNNSSTPHGSCCCSVENRRTVRSRTACETHMSFGHLAACPCCRLCLHSSLRCISSAATQLSIGRLLQRLTAYRTSAISSFLRLFLQIINSNFQQLLAFSSCSSGLSIPDGALLLFFFSSFRRPLSLLFFGPQSHFVLVGPIRFL